MKGTQSVREARATKQNAIVRRVVVPETPRASVIERGHGRAAGAEHDLSRVDVLAAGDGIEPWRGMVVEPRVPAERVLEHLDRRMGAPLSDAHAARVQAATGHRPHGAQVHRGPVSAAAASLLRARAFTVGSDIHLSPRVEPDDAQVLAHEAAHAIQQTGMRDGGSVRVSAPSDALEQEAVGVAEAVRRGGTATISAGSVSALIQRDTVTDIEAKLSYGVFDWAITDADAHHVLYLLQALPAPQLQPTLRELGQTYIDRLLDNVSRADRALPIYGQIIAALGPAGIRHEAESLLSYGVFDWSITDADANQVLEMLERLAPADLDAAVRNLGEPYVARLLDNLPAAARARPIYNTLVTTLGRQGVLPYIESLLSTGFFQFDWAITDAEATEVFSLMVRLPLDQQRLLLKRLHDHGYLAPLIDNATAANQVPLQAVVSSFPSGPALSAEEKALLKTMFDASSNDHVATMALELGRRFDVATGPYTGASTYAPAPGAAGPAVPFRGLQFDAAGLRHSWSVLEALPVAHVEGNSHLDRFERYDDPIGHAQYEGAPDDRVALGYRAGDVDAQDQLFEDDVRHEVGHAVDARMGAVSLAYMATAAGGGWQNHGSIAATLSLILQNSGGAINTWPDAGQKAAIIAVLNTAMTSRAESVVATQGSTLVNLRALPFFAALTPVQQRSITSDPAVAAVVTGLQSAWWKPNGGVTLGDLRVYHESYANLWVSYDSGARARKVSNYQFRAMGEWFAEAYVWYYKPDSRGRGEALADHDRPTKVWFDANVQTLAPG